MRGFFTYWQHFLGEWLGQHVAFDLRNQIYDRLQRLSYAYHDKQQTGQLMSRATQDVEATRMFIQMGALRLLDMSLRIVVAAALMFMLELALALVAWALMPLVAFQSIRIQLKSRQHLDGGAGAARPHDDGAAGEHDRRPRGQGVLARALRGARSSTRKRTSSSTGTIRQNRIQAQNNPFYQAMSHALPGRRALASAPSDHAGRAQRRASSPPSSPTRRS